MASPVEPSESLARIDLPIRDVLRFIVPGGFGAISAALIDHVLWKDALGIAKTELLVPIGFVFGLVAFVGEFHARLWPWKKHWHIEIIENISKEITSITGSELARREKLAKPIYKLWIEAVCPPGLRGYLHYTTGIYYTTVAVSFYSVLFAAIAFFSEFSPYAILFYYNGKSNFLTFLEMPSCLYAFMLILGFFILALLSYWMSKSCLSSISSEGRVAMQLDESRQELLELARAATRASSALEDKQVVQAIVEETFREFCPADKNLITSIQLDQIIKQLDIRDGSEKKIAHVTITSEKPFILNGGSNLYVGEQQRVLEGALTLRLSALLNVHSVRLQFGPIPIADMQDYASIQKRVSRLALDEALSLGVIIQESPAFTCCKEFNIQDVLVRSRFVIGPSPGLVSCLKNILAEFPTGMRVLDPFAGTRLVEKVCKSIDKTSSIFSYDRFDENGNLTTFDAFDFIPHEEYDLVVIDPLYEDCLAYIANIVPQIKAKHLLVQSGRACDVGWNNAVHQLLKKLGNVEVPKVDMFGSSLFFVTRF